MQRKQHPVGRFRQRGLSFFGLVFLGVFLIALFAIGGQSIPVLLESQAISKAVKKAAREGSTVKDVQAVFDRAAAIDDITSVQGKDLEVTKRGDTVVVTARYAREIPLAGPAYLVYRFNIQSD